MIRLRRGLYATRRDVDPLGIERVTDIDVPFLIASPTEAVCDRIALEPYLRSIRDARHWPQLMRLPPDLRLDLNLLRACAEGYGRPADRLLHRAAAGSGQVMT